MKSKILRISIIGRTNAGKSTLINSIVGEKISILNKKINTTQETITGIKNIPVKGTTIKVIIMYEMALIDNATKS